MRITKNDIPTKIDIPGAKARQKTDFGDASGYGAMGAEYFSLGAGADIAPLLQGLHDDVCHAPHWGFVISGKVIVTYTDGTEETNSGQDLFHWPAGHSVRVVDDAEVVLFSPQVEHTAVMDHMLAKLAG
ncbi:MAG: cupin domain-containing protein [Mycobacteriales bacterium]